MLMIEYMNFEIYITTKHMKKKFKPLFTADVTACENEREIVVAFAEAKVDAGLPITRREYDTCMSDAKRIYLRYVTIYEKKPNVFKRFWNWLTRKK